jgi:hypothetical protein
MNERIRELAIQAGATVDKGTHPLTGVVDGLFMGPNEVEKFAELIVKECVSIVKQRWIKPDEDVIAEEIEEHFGVEE